MASAAALLAAQRSDDVEAFRRDALGGGVGKGGLDGGQGRVAPEAPWSEPWVAPAADRRTIAVVSQPPVYVSLAAAVASAQAELQSTLTAAGVLEQALVSRMADDAAKVDRAPYDAGLALVDAAVHRLHSLRLLGAMVDRAEVDAHEAVAASETAGILEARAEASLARDAPGFVAANALLAQARLGAVGTRVGVHAISVVIVQPIVRFETVAEYARRARVRRTNAAASAKRKRRA